MKKYLLPALLLPVAAWGQASFGHLDSLQLNKMQANQARAAAMGDPAEDQLTFFVRVADDATVARVEAAGATIDQREGNILIVTTPLSLAQSVAATEGVVSVSLPRELTVNAWTSDYGYDLSRTSLGLDRVQSASGPLTQAYTGEGVIVGVIDMGIDVHHLSLLNPDGTHRVKRAFKHVQNGKAVATLTSDTEVKMQKFTTDNPAATHGTHVMGIAAGNFCAPEGEGPDLRGAAPGADLAVSCGVNDTPRLIKGLRAIVDYAKAEGKPVVVNISMGSNSGPHDGTDEFPAALNEIAGEEGVTVCVSAGNEGNSNAFLYSEFDKDNTTLRSIFNPSNYTAAVWPGITMFPQAIGTLEIWSDDDTPFTVSLDVLKYNAGVPTVVGTYTLPASGSGYLCNEGMSPASGGEVCDDIADFNLAYRNSYIGGECSLYAPNNRYRAELSLQLECPDQAIHQSYRVALRIDGKEGHKVWVYSAPMSDVFPYQFIGGAEGYTASTSDGSLNAMSGAANVITVGSYVTHNMNGTKDFINTTAPYSSWGHSFDGRVHPLVSTPGSRIISSMSGPYVDGPYYDAQQVKYYSYTTGGTTYHWTPMTGTSMAAPYMTGIAAMWLSADPTLTTEDIIEIAQQTAKKPALPRANDGAGAHVSAYEGLCKVLGLSGVNDIVTDAKAEYMVINNDNVLDITAPVASALSATMHNMQGAAVAMANAAASSLTLDCTTLTPGIYVLTVDVNGTTSSQKIVIK